MTDEELRKKVRHIMRSNTVEGYSKLLNHSFCYIMPSPSRYPFQWFWDTFFHIYILCALGEYDLAKRNMRSLFAMQAEDGFVGHMIFWKRVLPVDKMNVLQARPSLDHFRPHMSSLIQPTFAAQVVLRIYECTNDIEFLREFFPKLKMYHRWLRLKRDFEGDGLISIISPFESGIDWKPSYDEVVGFREGLANGRLYRRVIGIDTQNFLNRYDLKKIYKANYFIVKDVIINTAYVLDILALSKIAQLINEPDQEYRENAERVSRRMHELMFDEKTMAFYDVYGRQNRQSRVLTPSIFFPIVLPHVPADLSIEIIKKHLINNKQFDTPYPLPSVSVSEHSFFPYESNFLWRGPTWVFYNWFLYRCLKTKGFEDLAGILLATVKELIDKSGFREYYNPFSGAGYGAQDFTWSGLVVDMMQE